ncbi:MAG: hypothetical protein M1817_004413 [Caeruleum heppii]|nr:MAG: hypothetical protein M1817_004413 [Caeruleum heppii]
MFQKQDWLAAQKAAMVLQRAFTKKREYYFWACLCCHHAQMNPTTSETDRKLFGTLAYRLISKAAEAVPKDTANLLSPGRSVQTPQELQLLLSIFQRQRRCSEALGILGSANLGTDSAIAKGNWEVIRRKLDLFEENDLWHEEWSMCQGLLEKARPQHSGDRKNADTIQKETKGDDWRVWKGLLSACQHIDQPGSWEATRDLIDSFLRSEQVSRNARLAQVHYCKLDGQSKDDEKSKKSDLFDACISYFEATASMVCCFRDLKTYLEDMGSEMQRAFADHAVQFAEGTNPKSGHITGPFRQRVAARVNALKIYYLVHCSADTASNDTLDHFVLDCLKLYKASLKLRDGIEATDDQPGDDAGVLAAMALVKLVKLETSAKQLSTSTRLIQAAGVLQYLLSHSKHHYQALLIAIQLYHRLGAISMSCEAYRRLGIKQVQYDTLSYNILTRVSTYHPYAVTALDEESGLLEEAQPSAWLTRALEFYAKTRIQVPKSAQKALENGSYDQVWAFFEFGGRVEQSLCQVMWKIERRRVLRLTLSPKVAVTSRDYVSDGSVHKDGLLNLVDNRDFDVIISHEGSKDPSFADLLRSSPLPRRHWISAFRSSERIMDALHQVYVQTSSEQDPVIIDQLEEIVEQLRKVLADPTSEFELTNAESVYLQIQALIAETLAAVSAHESVKAAQGFQTLMVSLREHFESALAVAQNLEALSVGNLPEVPAWDFLHRNFLLLDNLKALRVLSDHGTKDKKSSSGSLDAARVQVRDQVEKVFSRIRSRAANIKNQLSDSGVVGSLVDAVLERREDGQDAVGAAIEDLTGEAWMETFLSRIVGSWDESLDGLLRVKLS